MIEIYTTETCWTCKMIMRMLENKWIEYKELSAIEHYDKLKEYSQTVPIIFVNGEYIKTEDLQGKI